MPTLQNEVLIHKVLEPNTNEKHNALLVVGALLVTVTYQVVLSPSGGLWPDDQSNDVAPHRARIAIGMRGWSIRLFLIFNSVTFVLSNAIILLLAPFSGYFRGMFWAFTLYLGVC